MTNIKKVLRAIDKAVKKAQPQTMDDFLTLIGSVEDSGNYGAHYEIVYFMGTLQGVRMYVTGRKISHQLPPAKDSVYTVTKGLEKYLAAGWTVRHANKYGV